jgi:hypothetical protein
VALGDTAANYMTSFIQTLLVKLVVIQLVKKFPLLKNPEVHCLSEIPAIRSYRETVE